MRSHNRYFSLHFGRQYNILDKICNGVYCRLVIIKFGGFGFVEDFEWACQAEMMGLASHEG